MEYRVEVNTTGDPVDSWSHNAILFSNPVEAVESAFDLFMRWTAVKYWRVTDTDGKCYASNKEGEADV